MVQFFTDNMNTSDHLYDSSNVGIEHKYEKERTPFFLKRPTRMRRFWKWGTLLIALLICLFWMILPPKHFPVDTTFHIREGMSMRTIALSLHESHMVRSATLFQLITKITGQAENLQAGNYASYCYWSAW
jgi:hypothetical protein